MGRNVDGLKKSLENLSNKEVTGNTKGEVFANFNIQYVDVSLTIAVEDSVGEAIASPTIVLKTGTVVGSGDTVSAVDGKYPTKMGSYNYSVSKTGYITETGVISVVKEDAKAEAKAVTITLNAPCELTIKVEDDAGQAIASPTITLKTGAVVGSGDIVSAVDGKYPCSAGDYNYSVSKTNYVTKTGTLTITDADLNGDKTETIVLEADA